MIGRRTTKQHFGHRLPRRGDESISQPFLLPLLNPLSHFPLPLPSVQRMSHPTALLIIDNQQGFSHPTHWGPERSNPSYESNLVSLLSAFRTASPQPLIIHIAHSSLSPLSPLHPSSTGHAFYPSSTPLPGELSLTKFVNSAFIGTDLEAILRAHGVQALFVAGLSTDHCVSTTVRMAGNLGVAGRVVLVWDATAAWRKPGGEWDAETVHAVHVESLREFAEVRSTKEVLRDPGGGGGLQ